MVLFAAIRVFLALLVAVVVIVTALPISGSHAWWIRGWDFPRVQIVALAVFVLALIAIFTTGPFRLIAGTFLVVCIVYQATWIYRFTPLASTEIALADPGDCSEIVTLFSANVLMENTEYDALIGEIKKADPDVLLLMETDQTWIDAVEPVLENYDTVIRVPLDNHYGLVFATRLRVKQAVPVYLVDDKTPAIFAELEDQAGRALRYVGLHPRPPVPGNDTEERDAQILFSARFAQKSGVPLVAMGDFNDAAWSDTTQMFKKVGEYLDPRIGRGFYASFDARSKLLRSPIDHFYVTKEVAVVSFSRGEFFGSDHFPIVAKICLDADLAARLNSTPPPIPEDVQKRSDEIIANRRAELDGVFKD